MAPLLMSIASSRSAFKAIARASTSGPARVRMISPLASLRVLINLGGALRLTSSRSAMGECWCRLSCDHTLAASRTCPDASLN